MYQSFRLKELLLYGIKFSFEFFVIKIKKGIEFIYFFFKKENVVIN